MKQARQWLQELNGYARLAIILSLSLLVHLAIIYGVPWSPGGGKNVDRSVNTQPGRHRLTVTLTPAAPAATAQQSAEKSDARAVVETEADLAGVESPTNALISTALETRYFTVAELDQHPAIARDIADNPPELLEHSQGGEIVLRLWIDKTGSVVSVDPVSSNLPPVFVDSARAGFLQAAFLPGRKNGNAVATVMDIVVSYAPVNQSSQH